MDYLPIILFVVATCISPGPNNIMLISSGVNHGIFNTLRHVAGINLGFPIMVLAVGVGAGALINEGSLLYSLLRPISFIYICLLAYKIAISNSIDLEDNSGSPLGVLQAALFQWVNPKAWLMATSAAFAYASPGDEYLADIIIIALIFLVFGIPCSLTWVFLGNQARKILSTHRRLAIFNICMALLLIVSIAPMLTE